ncbi:flagellin [Curvivirga sp.]|uniref:flagellin n=1 Tax=Curvivirga sp. TaxID=2856848 RepID=UPI003B5A80FB
MTEVTQTAAVKNSLQSVQRTTALAGRAQENLTTGRRVNDVNDNPLAFFIAKALTDTANTLTGYKSGVDQAVSSVSVANVGIETIENFADQMKGLVEAARSASPSEQRALSAQFAELGNQISQIAQDASYLGQNLLSGNNTAEVRFDSREDSQLTVDGFNLNGAGIDTDNGLFSVAAYQADGSFDADAFGLTGGTFTSIAGNPSAFSDIINTIDSGIDRLRGQAAQLGSNVAILQERINYTENQVNVLETGADKLTLADLNEEAATLVAANTRSQLGINSIALAGQQSRNILELLGQG